MAFDGEILWFSPERRGLIPLDGRFHVPHGLKRSLRRRPFEVSWDTAFREVMLACAQREDTWIDGVILESYCALHSAGSRTRSNAGMATACRAASMGSNCRGCFSAKACFRAKPTPRRSRWSPW